MRCAGDAAHASRRWTAGSSRRRSRTRPSHNSPSRSELSRDARPRAVVPHQATFALVKPYRPSQQVVRSSASACSLRAWHGAAEGAPLAPEPLEHGHRVQGAPASGPLARADPRRGGVRHAHAPSLGSAFPCSHHLVRFVDHRPSPFPDWLSTLSQPPDHEQGEGCLTQHQRPWAGLHHAQLVGQLPDQPQPRRNGSSRERCGVRGGPGR
jgi:hypothetical protein